MKRIAVKTEGFFKFSERRNRWLDSRRVFGFTQFFHHGLHQLFCVDQFLMNHAQIHGRHGRVSLAGAIHAVLTGEDKSVGDAVERHSEAPSFATEHLLVMLEFFLVFLKR